MQILYSRCCGIDVHKDSVTACVLVYKDTAEPEVRKKEFATHKKALGNLRLWLHANQVTHVAMESTGVYWKPVWQALEENFDLTLANPYQIKNIPTQKTDRRDSASDPATGVSRAQARSWAGSSRALAVQQSIGCPAHLSSGPACS